MSLSETKMQSDSSSFWQLPSPSLRLHEFSYEEVLIEGDMHLLSSDSKPRHFYLTRTSLAYSTVLFTQSQVDRRIRRVAMISHARVTPFEEKKQVYGLRVMQSSDCFTDLFCSSCEEMERWLDALATMCCLTDIESDYKFMYKLGAGSYAEVIAAKEIASDRLVAVKRVDKNHWGPWSERLSNEVAVLRSLNHPGIVRLLRVYDQWKEVCLVLSHQKGVNLQAYIHAQGPTSGEKSKAMFRSLLEVVSYMHSKGVVHRDIKPENIIVNERKKTYTLIDFGFAIRREDLKTGNVCGTPGYVAPEILMKKKTSEKADVFSLGIVFYTVIKGKNPFAHLDRHTTLSLNQKSQLSFDSSKWPKESPLMLDLLKKMTHIDPAHRPSASDCLRHPWFICELEVSPLIPRMSLDWYSSEEMPLSEASTVAEDRSPI